MAGTGGFGEGGEGEEVKLEWENELTKCGEFAINTVHTRHGSRWFPEYRLWQAENGISGPPWKNAGIFDTKKQAKEKAQIRANQPSRRRNRG